MKVLSILKSKLFYVVIGLVIAAAGLLWGQGILIKPKVVISCGAIDYKIPAEYQMEVFSWKIMMSPEEVAKQLEENVKTSLKEYGFADDKIKSVMSILVKKDKLPNTKVEWRPYEQNQIKAALAKAQAKLLPDIMKKYLDIPDAALFFEIDNNGLASATNAHVIVRLNGSVYGKPSVESDNKLIHSVQEGSELSFDYDRLAPHSKTRGIIWYSHITSGDTLSKNGITVSFDQDTVHKDFAEDSFFMSDAGKK